MAKSPSKKKRSGNYKLRIGHTQITHGYLKATKEKQSCSTWGTELTVNHILTECFKYTDDRKNLNILNTLDAALKPNAESTDQVLNFLKKSELYNLI